MSRPGAGFDEQLNGKINESRSVPVHANRVWLRAECDFFSESQRLSYSTDGVEFKQPGDEFISAYQLLTFQGVRYALFAFNTAGREGGYADFDFMNIHEPRPRGRQPIPYGREVTFRPLIASAAPAMINSPFVGVDRGLGRVRLKRGDSVVTVSERGQVHLAAAIDDEGQVFQWIETLTGDITFLSLKTHRYLRVDGGKGVLVADSPGPGARRQGRHALHPARQPVDGGRRSTEPGRFQAAGNIAHIRGRPFESILRI